MPTTAFDALIDVRDSSFVVARKKGHEWTPSELTYPFERVKLVIVEHGKADVQVVIHAKVGDVPVPKSKIAPGLVDHEVII